MNRSRGVQISNIDKAAEGQRREEKFDRLTQRLLPVLAIVAYGSIAVTAAALVISILKG